MRRRTLPGAVGGVAAVGAGCTGLVGCGPGDTELGAVADDPAAYADPVEIEGSIEDTTAGDDGAAIVVDDGTGTASSNRPPASSTGA